MMMTSRSSYKGDSPGKRMSRSKAWLATRNWMSLLGESYTGALVLAGEGGDVLTLAGWGIDADRATAVDLSQEAIDTSSERCAINGLYPRFIRGEAGEVALRDDVKFNVAHMDFCGGFCVENLKTLVDVAKGMSSYPAMLMVTMLKGREFHCDDTSSLVVDAPRGDRKRAARLFKECGDMVAAHVLKHKPFNPRDVLAMSEKRVRELWSSCSALDLTDSLVAAMARAGATRQVLDGSLIMDGLHCQLLNIYGYHSATKEEHGSPFVTFLVLIRPATDRRSILSIVKENGVEDLLRLYSFNKAQCMSSLRQNAVRLDGMLGTRRAAMVLGLKPGQISAWKAHMTMGTYKDDISSAADGLGFSHNNNGAPVPDSWGGAFHRR